MPAKESLQGVALEELSVEKEAGGELLPKVELVGGLTDINITKKSVMDQHQYTLRG